MRIEQLKRFTLFELCLIVVALLMLAGMFLPVLSKKRERSHTPRCPGGLKQIGLALLMYSGENSKFFILTPDGTNFEPLNTEGVLSDGKAYGCPSAQVMKSTAADSGYCYQGSGIKDDHPDPTNTVIAFDLSGNHPDNDWMNALFVDGHVEGARPDGTKTWNTYPPQRGGESATTTKGETE